MRKKVGLLGLVILLTTVSITSIVWSENEGGFVFGIEYVFPGDAHKIAQYYSEIGATASKFNGPGTFWEDVEPNPPANGKHLYNWSKIDEAIKGMQKAGFLNLTMVIGPKNKWGSKPVPKGEGIWRFVAYAASTPPKDEHWDDYAAWVTNFVERYDFDGVNDMPGLKAPVLYYEIMTEAQHEGYWRGTVEDYIKVLKTSYTAAKGANPNVKIILSGFMFTDFFDEGPLTDTQIKERLNKTALRYPPLDARRKSTAGVKQQFEFNKRILQEKDYFDMVEFHLLSNYTALEGVVKWIRNEMQKNGYEKPLWVGDAGAVPQIPSHNRVGRGAVMDTFNQFSPPLYNDGDKIFEVLTSKQDKYGYSYKQVRQWFFKEQSYFLTKSIVIEMSLGVVGTNIYTWLDGRPQKWMTGALKNWHIAGLREGNMSTFSVGKPRPVFYTYKLLIEKLKDKSSVEKINLGNPKIRAYKSMVNEKPLYVLWLDDGINQKPGEQEAVSRVDLSSLVGSQEVKVTYIISEEDQTKPKIETVASDNILLTETPIFVEKE